MRANMVHNLLETVFTNHVVLDASRSRFPLEVVQTIIVVVSGFPTREYHKIRIIFIIAWIDAAALLHDPRNELWIIAGSNNVLERFFFVLFIPVLRDVRVFNECFLSSLNKALLLLSCWFEWVRQSLRWKVPGLLNIFNYGLLWFLSIFSFHFLTINTNLLGSTLGRIWRNNSLIFFLWIILSVDFELIERFTCWSLLARFTLAFVAVFFIADCIQISFSANTSSNVVFCWLTLPVFEGTNVIHHSIFVISIHQVFRKIWK